MSELRWDTQIRVGEEDGHPMVIDAGDNPDDMFDVLADERRVQVLSVLREDSTAMGLSTLVERVAERMQSDPSSEVAPRRLRISLHHQHLPKIAAAGLVEYDAENHIVVPTDAIQP